VTTARAAVARNPHNHIHEWPRRGGDDGDGSVSDNASLLGE